MRYAPVILVLSAFSTTLALGLVQPQKTVKKAAAQTTATPKKTATAKPAVAPGKPLGPAAKRSVRRKTVARRPATVRQGSPTPERYKEIQTALASKGYLKSEPSGVWDAESSDAMRRFQTDRNMDASGKLTAAALIDLGLGPKQDKPSETPAGKPPEPVPDPPAVASEAPVQP